MEQWAKVEDSGNANVVVYVDTTAIAYAMVSCLAATGQLSEKEIHDTVRQLNTMLENDEMRKRFFKTEEQDVISSSNDHAPAPYVLPVTKPRRQKYSKRRY